MHYYSTIYNTLKNQLMVLQILTTKDQVSPEISQWDSAKQLMEKKLSERNEFLSLYFKVRKRVPKTWACNRKGSLASVSPSSGYI